MLLAKLKHSGIQGSVNPWISTFLNGRTQTVVLEVVRSETDEVSSGVPQGSVIGPLLFSVFINDLPSKVKSDGRLFADDCILYKQIKNKQDALSLQKYLDNIQRWCRDWLIHLHPDKCEILRVTNERKPLVSTYMIEGESLKEVDTKKYLGSHCTNR